MFSPRRPLYVMLTALACTPLASLEAQRFGLGAHAGYFTLSGDDFEGIEAGRGFQGNAWYLVNPRFQLGLGVVRSSHDIDVVDDNIIDLHLFVEPRLVFPAPGTRFTPFIGARLGYAKQSIEIQGLDAKATGLGYGAIAGMDVQVGPTAALEFGVTYTNFKLGDVSVEGQDFADTETSGSILGIQAGIVFWFGARP